MYRALFVCTGNTCRSPMAAALFFKILRERGEKSNGFQVDSAGIHAPDNAPASPEAVEVMRRVGIDLSGHRTQRLKKEAVLAADLVVTMTRSHKEAVLALFPEAGGKVFTLRELAGKFFDAEERINYDDPGKKTSKETKENKREQEDIADPYGRDLKTYEACAREIEECLQVMARTIGEKKSNAQEQKLRVAVASDHAGFILKEEVVRFLKEQDFVYHDFGVYTPESVDYTDQAALVAREIAAGNYDRGILLCGTGIGVSIAANKIRGIRAALCHDVFSARMARAHNDSNILTMGARVIGVGPAMAIVENYLAAEFLGGRHQTRVDKIKALEE